MSVARRPQQLCNRQLPIGIMRVSVVLSILSISRLRNGPRAGFVFHPEHARIYTSPPPPPPPLSLLAIGKTLLLLLSPLSLPRLSPASRLIEINRGPINFETRSRNGKRKDKRRDNRRPRGMKTRTRVTINRRSINRHLLDRYQDRRRSSRDVAPSVTSRSPRFYRWSRQ